MRFHRAPREEGSGFGQSKYICVHALLVWPELFARTARGARAACVSTW